MRRRRARRRFGATDRARRTDSRAGQRRSGARAITRSARDGPGFAIALDGVEDNIVAGNQIEGHPSGILIFGVPGQPARRNVVRDNTTAIRGAGIPVGLYGGQDDAESFEVEDNLIERNRILGGKGVGIHVHRASRNRIVENTITGITLRDPSLGEANGAGIHVSPGSDENQIVGNTFQDIATFPIFSEGDRYIVQTRSATDAVHNLGTGNRVIRP